MLPAVGFRPHQTPDSQPPASSALGHSLVRGWRTHLTGGWAPQCPSGEKESRATGEKTQRTVWSEQGSGHDRSQHEQPHRPTLVLWTSLNCFLIALVQPKLGVGWSSAPRRWHPGKGNSRLHLLWALPARGACLKHCLCPAEDGAHRSILLCGTRGRSQGLW